MQKVYRKLKSPKLKPSNIYLSGVASINSNKIILKWSESQETRKNFGDALNPWLFERLTGKKPINAKNIVNISRKPVYSMIGSILDNNKEKDLIIWGSGFKQKGSLFKFPPQKICAVRGPLSRQNIIDQGLSCPEIYGDPALLLPKVYKPIINKKYKLGIIPHYVDKNNHNLIELSKKIDSDINIIDIESGIESFIDNILSCEMIASSSLHGLIVADAYGIPSLQIKFSNRIKGGNFKFRDYMESVGRIVTEPLEVTKEVSIQNILDNFTNYSIEIDLEKLLKACPFKINI